MEQFEEKKQEEEEELKLRVVSNSERQSTFDCVHFSWCLRCELSVNDEGYIQLHVRHPVRANTNQRKLKKTFL